MKYKNKKGNLANILTYLGLVPFVFLTLLITKCNNFFLHLSKRRVFLNILRSDNK